MHKAIRWEWHDFHRDDDHIWVLISGFFQFDQYVEDMSSNYRSSCRSSTDITFCKTISTFGIVHSECKRFHLVYLTVWCVVIYMTLKEFARKFVFHFVLYFVAVILYPYFIGFRERLSQQQMTWEALTEELRSVWITRHRVITEIDSCGCCHKCYDWRRYSVLLFLRLFRIS